MKRTIIRKQVAFALSTCMILILGTVAAYAVPMPWIISNLDPDGETTFVRDQYGDITCFPVLAQLILDVQGDGPDAPSAQAGSYGVPTDDDQLVASWLSMPQEDVCPPGGIIVTVTCDTDDPCVPENSLAYVRVIYGANHEIGTPFMDSEMFNGPTYPDGGQTVVRFPSRMAGYIGNRLPVIYADPVELEVPAGEEAIVQLAAEDDGEDLTFKVLTEELPGGEESVIITPLTSTTATVSWIPPFYAQGDNLLICAVTDGQYEVQRYIEVNVTAPSELPSAFHLASPGNEGILWESEGFTWQESTDPYGQEIHYSLLWASDPDFEDADSLTNITTNHITIDFDDTLIIQSSGRSTGNRMIAGRTDHIGSEANPNRGKDSNSSRKRLTRQGRSLSDPGIELSGESGTRLMSFSDRSTDASGPPTESVDKTAQFGSVDDSALPGNGNDHRILEIVEGQSIYWRVHAYDSENNPRCSAETWNAVAERADPPSTFHLLEPANGAELETLIPTLQWEAATDPDQRDTVNYDLAWSLDGWNTSDTIRAIPNTSYSFNDPDVNSLPGSIRFQEMLFARLFGSNNTDLDQLPDDVTVDWTVEAVDLTGLRSEAVESWSFSIAVPQGPDGFNLITPAHHTHYNQVQPVLLSWTPAVDPDPDAGQVRYDILATDDSGITIPQSFPVIAQDLNSLLYVYNPGPEDDRRIRWTIRAISGDDTTWASTGNEACFEFIVSAPDRPDNFSLLTPANNDTAISANPTLRWQKPPDPDINDPMTYTVYFSLDEWTTVDSIPGIPDTVFTFQDDVMSSLNSCEPAGGVRTEPIPGLFKTSGKENFASPGQMDDLQGFNRRMSKPGGTTSGRNGSDNHNFNGFNEIDEFPDSSIVFWKVRAQDSNSIGRWATPLEGWSFTIIVNLPPTSFNLISPEDEAIVEDNSITFSWEETTDPDGEEVISYVLFHADNPDFENADSVITQETSAEVSLVDYETGLRWWRVMAEDLPGNRTASNETWSFDYTWTYIEEDSPQLLPTRFAFSRAYPNPFNPTLNLVLAIPSAEKVSIRVTDILGRQSFKLGPRHFQPGYHCLLLDFSDKPSGTYFLQMENSSDILARKKVTLVK